MENKKDILEPEEPEVTHEMIQAGSKVLSEWFNDRDPFFEPFSLAEQVYKTMYELRASNGHKSMEYQTKTTPEETCR